MRIEQLPGLDARHISRLHAIGIHNCRQLLRAHRRLERFSILCQATQLPTETLRSLVQWAELSQIRGIGPATLATLHEIGIDSLPALADQQSAALQARFRQLVARPPNLAVIEDWIQQAQRKSQRQPRPWPS